MKVHLGKKVIDCKTQGEWKIQLSMVNWTFSLHLVVFPKMHLLNMWWSTSSFFLIIISHIFSENFIEISPIVQIIRRFSPSILTIFIDFFGFFDNLLLQRNSSCQHITDDVTIFFLFQSTLSRLLGVWEAGGCSNWPIPEKTTLRKPSLFRVKSFFDSQGIFFLVIMIYRFIFGQEKLC